AGWSRAPARDACASACSCPSLPALPMAWLPAGTPEVPPPPPPAPAWPLPASRRLVLRAASGHPKPTPASRDLARADPDENPAPSSGHPTASGEAISARSSQTQSCAARPIPVSPGQYHKPCGPVRPILLTRSQPDDCGSRIDLTAPGNENLNVSYTQ